MIVDEGVRQLDLGEQRACEADIGLGVNAVLADPLREQAARDAALAGGKEEGRTRCGVEGWNVRLQKELREGHGVGVVFKG